MSPGKNIAKSDPPRTHVGRAVLRRPGKVAPCGCGRRTKASPHYINGKRNGRVRRRVSRTHAFSVRHGNAGRAANPDMAKAAALRAAAQREQSLRAVGRLFGHTETTPPFKQSGESNGAL
jgi:hypothetical protein